MNETEQQLLLTLSDGEFHSGEHIGKQFGLTRAAIWKQVKALEQRGIEIQASRRNGYCIPGGIELLHRKLIERSMDKSTRALIKNIIIHDQIDSTNDYLMEYAKNNSIKPIVCLAEQQTQGKGSRGR